VNVKNDKNDKEQSGAETVKIASRMLCILAHISTARHRAIALF